MQEPKNIVSLLTMFFVISDPELVVIQIFSSNEE